MSEKPLVSIITPCYNSEKWVSRYLESLLRQTYSNIQLIVINDGSHDKTEEIVLSYREKLAQKGMQLTYQYQDNKGLGGAIQTGLHLVRGEYFTWCDSDNFYTPDYVEEKVRFFAKHPEYAIVRCDGYVVKDSDIHTPISRMADENTDKFQEHLFYNALLSKNFHFGCAMLRTKEFDTINPERKIYESREGQNWQLMLPMLYYYRSGYIDKPMFVFVIRMDSISNVTQTQDLTAKIKQIDEYIKILQTTICSMHIKEEADVLNLINARYARLKLKAAAAEKCQTVMKEQYAIIKRTGLAQLTDTLIYYSGRFGCIRSLYQSAKKIRSAFWKKHACKHTDSAKR